MCRGSDRPRHCGCSCSLYAVAGDILPRTCLQPMLDSAAAWQIQVGEDPADTVGLKGSGSNRGKRQGNSFKPSKKAQQQQHDCRRNAGGGTRGLKTDRVPKMVVKVPKKNEG